MKAELEKQLIEKYPKIFQVEPGNEMYPFSMFGIECGDGWYNILNTLCFAIQDHIDFQEKMNAHIVRKNKLVDQEGQIGQDMLVESIPQVIVEQVKEKFGTLRFYYSGGDDHISGMVRMAEAMSGVTCEVCGDRGELRGRGWWYTACDEHTKEEHKDGSYPESF